MNQACRRCIAATTAVLRTTSWHHHTRPSAATINHHKHLHTTTSLQKVKTGSPEMYKDGKRIVEEEDDITVLQHILLKFQSYDEPSLDGGFEFAKKAAKMTSVPVAKSFRIPGTDEVFQSVIADESGKKTVSYNLKKYQRCIALENLTSSELELYLSYVYKSLPVGVSVEVSDMKWEQYADPHNPLHRKDKKAAFREIMKDTMRE